MKMEKVLRIWEVWAEGSSGGFPGQYERGRNILELEIRQEE